MCAPHASDAASDSYPDVPAAAVDGVYVAWAITRAVTRRPEASATRNGASVFGSTSLT